MNNRENPSQSSDSIQPVIPELVSELGSDPRMGPVIEIFWSELPTLTESLLSAFRRKNGPTIQRTAHRLKGAAASAGFSYLSELASQIETHAGGGHIEAAEPMVNDLARLCRLAAESHPSSAKP